MKNASPRIETWVRRTGFAPGAAQAASRSRAAARSFMTASLTELLVPPSPFVRLQPALPGGGPFQLLARQALQAPGGLGADLRVLVGQQRDEVRHRGGARDVGEDARGVPAAADFRQRLGR